MQGLAAYSLVFRLNITRHCRASQAPVPLRWGRAWHRGARCRRERFQTRPREGASPISLLALDPDTGSQAFPLLCPTGDVDALGEKEPATLITAT